MEPTASVSYGSYNYGLQIGVNYGAIQAGFHAPERPETPPSPLSNVPFPRDPDFVRRDALTHQIHDKHSVPGSRIALVGLGGVGKSQLAIEYSYQAHSESPDTWIFWVHASNEARFEQSFRDIADQIKLPRRREPGVNIFHLVQNWLLDETKGRWICVLDNVDDEFLYSIPAASRDDSTKVLANTPTKPLLSYIPRKPNGFTIITTRRKDIALRMVDHKDLIEVKPMDRCEALDLLQKKLDQPGNSQESQQLVGVLEFMPLAIVHAASYIRNRIPRYSVTQYLGDFQRSDREATKLLRKEVGHTYQDWEGKTSILVTWHISFDYIRQVRQSAADLLALMSFFDRQGIPESLIRDEPKAITISNLGLQNDSSDKGTAESDLDSEFEDDVTMLRDYSFIFVSDNGTLLRMHRLVQLATRAWLRSHGHLEKWTEKSINTLSREFPTGEYENWGQCQVLYPHVKAVMSQYSESPRCRLELAALLYRGAWYASESGLLSDMEKMASWSRNHRVNLLGAEDEISLESTQMLGKAFWLKGRWQEAEQIELQVMNTNKSKLGKNHPKTLHSMTNLASTYCKQGRWEEAEQLLVYVTEISKTTLGKDNPNTLLSITNLALTYYSQGRWEDAEQLFAQLIESHKVNIGDDHSETLKITTNLASTYLEQGRLEQAEKLFLQVIQISKIKLGEDHLDTLSCMSNLALAYWKQGRWEEARQLHIHVIEGQKIKLDEDHPDTLTSIANLASVYCSQDRWKDAEQLLMQVIQKKKIKLGENHPDTLTSIANLASAYCGQGRWKEAEEISLQVMQTCMMKLGEDHPGTLSSMANLASAYWNQGRWKEAEQLFIQLIQKSRKKLGENHPDTLIRMASLALTYCSQGRWKEAEQLSVQVVRMNKIKLGEDHPDTLRCIANLASVYGNQGRWEEAEHLFVQVTQTITMKLGKDHPFTLKCTANLAMTYYNQDRWKEAEQLLVQVIQMSTIKLGKDHPDTLSSVANLAFIYRNRGQ